MDGQRLDGWKAIANFLGRDRATAIRWAKERGLPVHRVPGGRTGSVFARPAELEEWLAGSGSRNAGIVGEEPARDIVPDGEVAPKSSPPRAGLRRFAAPFAALLVLIGIGSTLWLRDRAAAPLAPVGIAPVVSPSANAATVAFADALTADLARFADASGNLVVFERDARHEPRTRYVVHIDVDRASSGIQADVRLVATDNRQVMWSRHFAQTRSLSELRAQLAAKLIGTIRCSLDGLEGDIAKATNGEVAEVMAICDVYDEGNIEAAYHRARRLTETSPKLGVGWAMRAVTSVSMTEIAMPIDRRSITESVAHAQALAPDSISTAIATAAAAGPGGSSPEALPIVVAALRRHPDNPWLLSLQSMILFNMGYVQASVAPAIASARNDPSSLNGRDIAVRRLAAAGRVAEALSLQTENERLWPGHPGLRETRARIVPAKRDDSEMIVAMNPPNPYLLARIYEQQGDHDAALRWLARAPDDRVHMQWSLLFWPDAAGLRAEPAFFDKMARLGLVRWWVARRQWPDFCAEPGLKYSCAAAAAKRKAAT